MNPRLGALFAILLLSSGCIASELPAQKARGGVLVPVIDQPLLDTVIDEAEWAGAAKARGEFVIADSSPAEGRFPFELWLGTTSAALYVAIRIDLGNWTKNPLDVEDQHFPLHVQLLLTEPEGGLSIPSDWLSTAVYKDHGSGLDEGYWNGQEWVLQFNRPDGEFNEGYPSGDGRWSWGDFEDGLLTVEYYIGRSSPLTEVDGFNLPPGGAFRLALVFQVQDQPPNEIHPFGRHYDVFPGEGYSPDSWRDVAEWLRFRAES